MEYTMYDSDCDEDVTVEVDLDMDPIDGDVHVWRVWRDGTQVKPTQRQYDQLLAQAEKHLRDEADEARLERQIARSPNAH